MKSSNEVSNDRRSKSADMITFCFCLSLAKAANKYGSYNSDGRRERLASLVRWSSERSFLVHSSDILFSCAISALASCKRDTAKQTPGAKRASKHVRRN